MKIRALVYFLVFAMLLAVPLNEVLAGTSSQDLLRQGLLGAGAGAGSGMLAAVGTWSPLNAAATASEVALTAATMSENDGSIIVTSGSA